MKFSKVFWKMATFTVEFKENTINQTQVTTDGDMISDSGNFSNVDSVLLHSSSRLR